MQNKLFLCQIIRHPIIQIASVVKQHNQDQDLVRMVLTLKGCNPIPGAVVKSFEKEEDMLLEWQRFVQETDPDLFLGYNITNFDFPYILNRAQHLISESAKNNKKNNCNNAYGYLGRIQNKLSILKDGKYLSKAMGMRDTKEMNLEGRIQLDMLMHMHREQKLSSYTLNSVSSKFLKEQKEDVHHSEIYKLQNQNNETRKRLAVYCLKDSQLPMKLMEKLMCLYNYAEMARVTGVPLNFLFTRGQQIKVASQLYRKAIQCDMLIPTIHSGKSEGKYEGAYVLDPKPNFYEQPIATLDFASLYPSKFSMQYQANLIYQGIMMAHNLCYSSLIQNKDVLNHLSPDDYTKTPHGDYFVKSSVRKGLLPQILEELIAARKQAKNDLAKETDPMKKAVLDGRQLALKISANSVYGFTGAQVGQLPCLEISSSVTAFGRQMIDFTKNFVLQHYNIANGFQNNSDVVYGDTDSVMVNFGVKTVEEAMKLGREAAEQISKQFIKPIKLEFEKVYFPYLLMSKKRYAGVYWTKPDKYDKVDTKGIENVRRDNCALIRQLINKLLDKVLLERDKKGAIDMIKNTISDLLQNKIDISLLVITKALTKSIDGGDDDDDEDDNNNNNNSKNATKKNTNTQTKNSQASQWHNDKENQQPNKNQYKARQAHVELAERMRKRDEGSAPHIGDRIPYVIIAGAKGSKNFENSEDPIEVLDKDLPIDFDYYIEKQLKPPIMRIFVHILPNPQSLFVGEHTKIRYMPKVQNSAMGKFYKATLTCLSCRGPVNGQEAVCERCQTKSIDVYMSKIFENNLQQSEFADIWTQCQRCQGSLHYDVICSNRDCPIFYKRKKLQKDIEQGIQVLNRFSNDW